MLRLLLPIITKLGSRNVRLIAPIDHGRRHSPRNGRSSRRLSTTLSGYHHPIPGDLDTLGEKLFGIYVAGLV